MYAIVRCGGRQEKASVDDVLTVDRLTGEVGSTLTLPAVLVVDGDNVVTDVEELGGYEVAAEIVGDVSGPKINMIRYKNKTGYRRRLGHRQQYTQVKITGITKAGDRQAARPSGTSKAASTRAKPAEGKGASTSTRAKPGEGNAAEGKAASTRAKPAEGKAASTSTRAKPGEGKSATASTRAKPATGKAAEGKAAADEAQTAEES